MPDFAEAAQAPADNLTRAITHATGSCHGIGGERQASLSQAEQRLQWIVGTKNDGSRRQQCLVRLLLSRCSPLLGRLDQRSFSRSSEPQGRGHDERSVNRQTARHQNSANTLCGILGVSPNVRLNQGQRCRCRLNQGQRCRVSVASHRRTSNRYNRRMLVTAFVTTQTSRPPDALPSDIQQQQFSEPAAQIRGMSSLPLPSVRADVGRSGAATALRPMAHHTSPTRRLPTGRARHSGVHADITSPRGSTFRRQT
jgi:hypothetical protein